MTNEIQGEVWKPIEGWEGFYCVSNTGKVKSLSRLIERPRYGFYRRRERILKPTFQKKGRSGGAEMVILRGQGKSKRSSVHNLVAEAFLEKTGVCINHKDSNPRNNNVNNIEYVSIRENTNHYYGTQKKYDLPRGVQKRGNRFYAVAMHNGKTKYLGSFKKMRDAQAKYLEFVKSIGEEKYAE